MLWDDNFDLSSTKKSGIGQDRRTSKTATELLENSIGAESTMPRTKKTGVWGEDDKPAKRGSGINIIELERFQKDNPDDSDDDIPIIPDIDDLQDDPLNLPDVKKLVSVDESTYKELDNQFDNLKNNQMNFGNLGDIDLSFLTAKLYPESEVQEGDEVWTMDSLYMDLSKTSI